MDIRLIAFDLDDTFLNTEKQIPPENLEAIRAAADAGVTIVPASGRVYAAMPDALKLPFIRYYITGNGMCIYDSWTGQDLCCYEISFEMAKRLMDYAEENHIIYDFYQSDRGWMERQNFEVDIPRIIKEPAILNLYRSIRTPVDGLRRMIERNAAPAQKMQFYFEDPAERLHQLDILPDIFPELAISSSIPYNIEINDVRAQKGKALIALCEHLGFSAGQAMAFGDGLNDISMLQAAGIGVAMENAGSRVKAAADVVTGHCNDAGVAQAIRRYAFMK